MFFMNFKYHWFIYFLITIFVLMMNSNNIFIQWMLMEFGTIISISLINIKSTNKTPSLIYYSVSVISSIFLFFMIIVYLSSISFTKTDTFNFMVQMMFFLKIGTFPFHFWMIYSYEMMNWKQIFLMSTLIKFIPIYMMVSMTKINSWTLYFLITNSLYISFYANKFYTLKKLLACSTIFNSFYFIFILELNKNMFIAMIILYSFNYFLLISFLNKFNIQNFNFMFYNKYQMYTFLTLMFNYSMYPIFLSFVIKWNLIFMMVSVKAYNWILFLLMISSMLMIWNYIIILKRVFLKMNFYKNNFIDDKDNKYMYHSYFALTLLSFNISFFITLNFL
ncbi:NADH dehydrogenase subunit 2 (mitochondrion) [Apis mellifera ligustica]|uniref:NADH-ubiquinone oxidoreductase chain 2 n=6 Tax=Apis mellifera TaxID=7460 RepID=NU2M_APILI|nr:NADH dehydrogenase subunit 2 [Apis mellifera ligustica]P34849.1 RecName: Full=NADH-ubiquinone oxidoreductase chain 2; AltName: Full=NADH dehydrogenase subunit 2 [Apis mellifera ligustica]BBB39409.1 NADH dehydrogenase subunit 2 [Apis mellifera]AAB96798.1 NADH dehydrogenase subunit 2 [Apis mellifera ligustica]ARR27638.1 NADH dehydrogenase subunit 2 [Apis mellifera ligustica]UML37896.1 NADH dehydrogenase subunit 2 [Apis mellifera ligustica]UML37909.1 NADH dehydrogenase subunit 2 [Apis mellife|eukprot:NP_008082.1 NADH dehydrogenase subunit 2 (mitochondrion) [Apis mellifera ligustica]